MNFHKTIGYLATFLLMVGLGAPDSFAGTTTLTFSKPSVTENSTVGVTLTVKLDPAPDTEVTVTVPVTVTVSENYEATEDLRPEPENVGDTPPLPTAINNATIDIAVGPSGISEGKKLFIINNDLFFDGGTLTVSVAAYSYDHDGDTA